jgi:protein-ribulosamine 3-kinase
MFASVQNKLKESLKTIYNGDDVITQLRSVGGGSINDCYSFSCNGKRYFVKINRRAEFPGMFEAEVKGLNLLRSAKQLVVPEVFVSGTENDFQFLLLEFLQPASESSSYWESLGKGLAMLHNNTSNAFGLDHNNYIGSLRQVNTTYEKHPDFLINCRLEPLLRTATDGGLLEGKVIRHFERFFLRLNELFPEEKPALLHGDLWNGNVMASSSGPAVYDPSVYFGHRETDIAMTKLFGGFSEIFYEAYNGYFPLEKGWEQRVEYFQLYPFLVHVNLFGASYSAQVKSIISVF